ncbi:MAG TPA: hypothetical protein VJ919_00930 [Tangfeifania sp.]|nr:hypothetical protein [Tangfeifania sp.]
MKKTIFFTLIIGAVVAVLNSCTTPPMEAAQEAYDYNAIVPKVLGEIVGPEVVTQTFTNEYTVGYHRGGSTWSWSADEATIVSVSEDTRVATLEFGAYPSDGFATITVTETTMGGITSDPVSKEIEVQRYCPYDMAALEGDYTGTVPDIHGPTVTMEQTSNLNELRVYNLAWFVPNDWGENWVEGDGSCIMKFSCDEIVTIDPQWIGDSDYPDVYGIKGSGTFDPDTKTITLTYDVAYGWDGSDGAWNGPWTTTLTMK